MKNILLREQHEGDDTEDVNRRPETKVLLKVQVRETRVLVIDWIRGAEPYVFISMTPGKRITR